MVSYIASCELNEVESTTYLPLGSQSNEVIMWIIAVSVLGGVDGKIPIRDESFNMSTPIEL